MWTPMDVAAIWKEVVGLGHWWSKTVYQDRRPWWEIQSPLWCKCISLAWHQQGKDLEMRILGSWEYQMCGPVVHMPTWAPNSHHGFPHACSHLSTCGSLLLHCGYPLQCWGLTLMRGSTGQVRTPVTNLSPCGMEQEGCSPNFKVLSGVIHLHDLHGFSLGI